MLETLEQADPIPFTAVECGQLEVVKLLCQHDPKQLRIQDAAGVSQEVLDSRILTHTCSAGSIAVGCSW